MDVYFPVRPEEWMDELWHVHSARHITSTLCYYYVIIIII